MEYENRESERRDALNLLEYVVIDNSGQEINRAMARTLNVSERGILLETHLDLAKGQLLRITIGLKNDLFEVKGVIVRAEKRCDNAYCYGIEFLDVTGANLATLRKFFNKFNETNNLVGSPPAPSF